MPPPEVTTALSDLPVERSMARSVFAIAISPLDKPLTLKGRKLHIALSRLAGAQYKLLREDERAAIERAQRDYVALMRRGQKPERPTIELQPTFYATLKELAELVGHDVEVARHLMADLVRLKDTAVRFNTLRQTGVEAKERELYPVELEVHTSLLSFVARNGKRGLISWRYDPAVLSIMVAPRTYAMLSLELVRSVRTYTALALYENCRKFVGTGSTGAYPIETWQRLLSPEQRRPTWENQYEFMRRVRAAILELHACDCCDILIDVERVRVAGVEHAVRFKVRPVDQARLHFDTPVPDNRELFDKLTRLGMSPTEITAHLDERGEEYLVTKVLMLERALQKSRGVENPLAWLRAAIVKDYQSELVSREAELAKARRKQAQEQQVAETRKAFAEHQSNRLRTLFYDAEEDVQAKWERRYAEQAATTALSLTGKAKEAAFFGWLQGQQHELFSDPADLDELAFVYAKMNAEPSAGAKAAKGQGNRKNDGVQG